MNGTRTGWTIYRHPTLGWQLDDSEAVLSAARTNGWEVVPVVDARLTPEAVEDAARVIASIVDGPDVEPDMQDRHVARHILLAAGFTEGQES